LKKKKKEKGRERKRKTGKKEEEGEEDEANKGDKPSTTTTTTTTTTTKSNSLLPSFSPLTAKEEIDNGIFFGIQTRQTGQGTNSNYEQDGGMVKKGQDHTQRSNREGERSATRDKSSLTGRGGFGRGSGVGQ